MQNRLDRRCITSALRSRDVTKLLEYGVAPSFFQGDYRFVVEYIYKHNKKYGGVPTVSTIKARFPWFRTVKADDSMEYYVNQIRERELFERVQESIFAAKTKLEEGSAIDAFGVISEFSKKINTDVISPTDLHIGSAVLEQLGDYDRRKEGDFSGITTGFPLLDKKILCYEATDFVVIAGPPGTGKTWYMMAKLASMLRNGLRVLLVSKEMKRKTIIRRITALFSQVNYRAFRHGNLEPQEESRFRRAVQYMSLFGDNLIIVGDDGFDSFFVDDYEFTNTLGFIESKIEQYRPDVVMIDGFYLLSAGGAKKQAAWEQATILTRSGKRLANRMAIPLIVTSQLNRDAEKSKGGPTLGNMGYSYSYAQDADVIEFILGSKTLALDGERMINLAKVREDEKCGNLLLSFNPAEKIDIVDVMDDAEVEMLQSEE